MLEDINIGQYYPGSSLVHRLDPRAKIIAAFIYMISLFVINNYFGYIVVIGAGLAVVLISQVPLSLFIRGLRPIFIIVIITLVLNMFLTPGTLLVKLGPLTITKDGLVLGIFMSIRLLMLVTVASLITLTTTAVDLTEGLERLMMPGKRFGIPAHELAMMMTIALRFIPTLLEETGKIIKAQKARGADFESGNLIQRARNLVPLLVPLFISAFRRADELATAMEARCYRGGEGRTRMKRLEVKRLDRIAVATSTIFFIISISSRWWL